MSTKYPLKQVILCRGATENSSNSSSSTHNEYTETFSAAGYNCHHLPTLRFEFIGLERIKDCLLSPNLYAGLIVTSGRAIEAIGLALQGQCLPEQWKNLPVYCVGPATSSLVRNNLKLNNCIGDSCGNAKDLANYIVADNARKCTSRSLLYPCSAIARDTIERVLNANGISLEKVVVYKTLPTETLEADLKRVITESPQIFVFFSPSTVEYISSAAARQHPELLNKIQPVAIGPASAEALLKAGMTVRAISPKPEPQALLRAIQQLPDF